MVKGVELLNAYYDKIYVISIERNLHLRLDKLKQNLKGINYEIFLGVDGKQLSEESINGLYNDEKAKKYLTEYFLYRYNQIIERSFFIGEIGVSLSHLKVYEDIIKNSYNKVLILEDDAIFVNKHQDLIENILKDIPSDCELFYWGYRWYDSESKLSRIKRLYIKTPILELKRILGFKTQNFNDRYPKPFKGNVWKSGYHTGSHAYAISLKTAKFLLKENSPVTMISDQLFATLVKEGKLNAYVANPLIFRDDQTFGSSVAEINKNNKIDE
jgi:glycosyl transferase family 25